MKTKLAWLDSAGSQLFHRLSNGSANISDQIQHLADQGSGQTFPKAQRCTVVRNTIQVRAASTRCPHNSHDHGSFQVSCYHYEARQHDKVVYGTLAGV